MRNENYVEYKNRIAFHPGYYIREIIDDSGMSQEDFAIRLNTTPKNLSLLVRGKQKLTPDIAGKLSNMLGTSVDYWLNLQTEYDSILVAIEIEKQHDDELRVLKLLQYSSMQKLFHLPEHPRDTDQQLTEMRKFLGLSSLTILQHDLSASFRQCNSEITESNRIKANAMVCIAMDISCREQGPAYSKKKFETAVEYALTQTCNHDGFYELISGKFRDAGVIFVVLPNIPGSRTNGAVKRIGDRIMLMVNDRNLNADTFWFSLFHEIGHILHGDFGISFDNEHEDEADSYARDCLIPKEKYSEFIRKGNFDLDSISCFAQSIQRDPGIIIGRLKKDRYISYSDHSYDVYIRKYRISFENI